MRLHRLELAAFGPYPGTVVVDLDRLSADGLFLLHGETGAGKTTLLDAVAFALFGRVPGVRNDAKRLRCDLADPHTRTEVTVEASVGPIRFAITRNPEYLRLRADGRGQTTERHRVLLRWIGPGPAGRPAIDLTRADDVGEAVRDLLGMSADQFFQVVLLPQGDFARFLRADTADREDLLERLFDTGRFGDIEEWFVRLRRDSHARLAILQEEVDTHAARVVEAAGLVERPEHAGAAWVGALIDDLAERAVRARADAEQTGRRREEAAVTLRAARDLHLRRQRWADARRGLAELDEQAAELVADRVALAAAERAAPAAAAAVRAGELVAEAERAHRRFLIAGRAVAALESTRPAAETGLPADCAPAGDDPVDARPLRTQAGADRERAGTLLAVAELAAEQQSDQRHAAELGRARPATERARDAAAAELVGLPDQLDDVRRRADRARDASARLVQGRQLLTAAQATAEAAAQISGERAAAAKASTAAAAAVDAHHRAVDRRQQLAEQRIAGMAGELGALLTNGQDCPVCGSTEHPRPAPSADAAVGPDDMTAAVEAERRAGAARRRAEQRSAAALARLASTEAAAGGLDEAAAKAATDAIGTALAADQHLADELPDLERRLSGLLGRREQLVAERERCAATLVTLDRDLATLADRIAGRAARLAHACAGHPSPDHRRAFLLSRADASDAWAAAAEIWASADQAGRTASEAADRDAVAAGFPDAAAARRAADIDVDVVRGRIRAAEDRRTALEGRLAAPDLAGIELTESVDLEVLARAAADADAAHRAATSTADAAAARCAQVGAAVDRLRRAWESRDPAAAQDAELAALADVVAGRGQNHRAMSLRAYVLAAKLREVAAAGSARLERMSGGRYTFVHSSAKESRGRSGGLGLDVLDGWSGQTRPTRTLSGGETFLASLALALGLSDVVAAESGGRVLDTLFIDEGFGTLDADVLELVMATLDELRSGGRIVGLVSHVDDLRQRIPSRLRVRTGPAGSELEMSVA
jgi:exonuclease SbcC